MMMDDEANSWIRRTNFSHTVCYRIDPSRLASIPFAFHQTRIAGLKSRVDGGLIDRKLGDFSSQFRVNPTVNQCRAVSPVPQTTLSDEFKEARSDRQRFSTPHPRKKNEKAVHVKDLLRENSHEMKAPDLKPPWNTGRLGNLSAIKLHDKSKSKRESSWIKYFDSEGRRVTSVDTADKNVVDLSKLFLGLRFAHGAHSQLYHGIYKDEGVAVKIIRVPDDDENGALGAQLENQFNKEVTLLSRLHHQNVIKFVAACRQPPVFCIVTEYLSEGSLRAYLHKLEPELLPLKKLIKMALEIARGMEYIHSQGVIHRDLKPENILINEDFQLKIADFGIGCEERHCDSLSDDPGTYRWMAPEMIKRKSYTRKVDVYGFGLILWEMVTGTIPYEDMTPIQAAFAVVDKNLRPAIPRECPSAMRALIEQCWSSNPEKRPEFRQVVKVLEQFESSLACDGTLKPGQDLMCRDRKKGLLRRIRKLGQAHEGDSFQPRPEVT